VFDVLPHSFQLNFSIDFGLPESNDHVFLVKPGVVSLIINHSPKTGGINYRPSKVGGVLVALSHSKCYNHLQSQQSKHR